MQPKEAGAGFMTHEMKTDGAIMAQQIGTLVKIPTAAADALTVSSKLVERSLIGRIMAMDVADMTAADCRQLSEWALTQPTRPTPASHQQIAKHLQFIADTLPAKVVDAKSGKRRFAVYVRMLDGQSNAALAYMSERILREHDWFPTPRQCLDILRDKPYEVTERHRAVARLESYDNHHRGGTAQERMEAFFKALRAGDVSQSVIDDKPEQWRLVAQEAGLLRRLDDGQFTQRRKVTS